MLAGDGGAGIVTALGFSPDSALLLAARTQAPRRGQAEQPIDDQTDESAPAMKPRGGGFVQLFDLATGEPRWAEPLRHPLKVWAVAFRPDGQAFVTADGMWGGTSVPGTTRLWDLQGSLLAEPQRHPASALSAAWSPDGSKLVTGHWDLQARVWNLERAEVELTLTCDGPVSAVGFDPKEGRIILTGSFGGDARLWDSRGRPLSPPLLHRHLIRTAVFSGDGNQVSVGTRDTIRLWDVTNLAFPEPDLPYRPERFPVAVDHEKGLILTQDQDGQVRVRRAGTGAPVGGSIFQKGGLITGAISGDGRFVGVVDTKRRARFWDTQNGSDPIELTYPEPAFAIAFSPDGRQVLTGHFTDRAILWDTSTLERIREFRHKVHSGPVLTVGFHPEGDPYSHRRG